MSLVALSSGEGICYIELSEVVAVSASFQKKGHEPSRRLMIRGGGQVYIHDNVENFGKLAHLLPGEAQAPWGAPAAKPKRKARKTQEES